MNRMACVNLPEFPVQLLLCRYPDWKNEPVAVVDTDKPQGTILYANHRARSFRILPGMRYAAGLSLTAGLRAAVVARREIESTITSLSKRLRNFSPHVEPANDEPGIFWLDASGLERLYDSLMSWAKAIRLDLNHAGFNASVVAGFTRFGTYALAKTKNRTLVLKTPEDEQFAAKRVPLDRLFLEPKTRDVLHKLGIKTVSQFINLPPDGITKRFGPDAHKLHKLARGKLHLPLQPEVSEPPMMQHLILDHPEIDLGRLMAAIEQLMDRLLMMLADRTQALTEVHVRFRFHRIGVHAEKIRTAAPTRDAHQLLDLIRLRLFAVGKLPDGVVEIVLVGQREALVSEQQRLLGSKPKRDLAAADRALARVRAELGNGAVRCAQLREGHLPEGRFTWEILDTMVAPKPRNMPFGRLIRRIHHKPIPLNNVQRQASDDSILAGLQRGSPMNTLGPYIVSGGWWQQFVHREYYYSATQNGETLWIYYDQVRHRWFLHGRVE
jgi:protein ImuB